MIQVTQMESTRTGNPVANQFLIYTDKHIYFQSYSSIIARRLRSSFMDDDTTLDENYWDYSRTTLKYLKVFLGTQKSKKEIEKDIKTGVYKTANLN